MTVGQELERAWILSLMYVVLYLFVHLSLTTLRFPYFRSFVRFFPSLYIHTHLTSSFSSSHKPLFYLKALRHSKVKLTWDDDDNARTKVTRRALSKKEMEEQDYRAYIASDSQASSSSSSSSEGEGDVPQVLDPTHNDADGKKNDNKDGKEKKKLSKEERRAKLRSMLLDTEDLPEGWGNVSSSKDEMTVTFAPGLSSKSSKKGEEEEEKEGERENENETTLERYQRRQREKKMARKEKALGKRGNEDGESGGDGKDSKTKPVKEDDFFGADSDSDTEKPSTSKSKSKKSKDPIPTPTPLPEVSSKAELSLILSNPSSAAAGPKHFDMKEVIKAEKENSGKKESRWKVKKEKRRKGKDGDHEGGEGEGEGGAGEGREDGKGFEVDVRDERFVALHDESEFAIDRSHPQCVFVSHLLRLFMGHNTHSFNHQRIHSFSQTDSSPQMQ